MCPHSNQHPYVGITQIRFTVVPSIQLKLCKQKACKARSIIRKHLSANSSRFLVGKTRLFIFQNFFYAIIKKI